jgi:predicted TIM-barrel fold metal-dependent hydrolase
MSSGIAARVVPVKYKPKFTADFVIDAHSHIQSGVTAPLPLLWDQVPGNVKMPRELIADLLGIKNQNDAGEISKNTIETIAERLVKEQNETYKGSRLLEEKPYKEGMTDQQKAEELFTGKAHIFSPTIIMPMDMDFAHIAGFPPESSTIYHEDSKDTVEMAAVKQGESLDGAVYLDGAYYKNKTKGSVERVIYYERRDAFAAENRGVIVDVSDEKPNHVWKYQAYYLQHEATVAAVKKNPWTLIPMFHYDPRRWCKSDPAEMDKKRWTYGPWDYPFKYIATLKNAGMFIGFKMYPPLGYKPLDPRLPNLEKFYARCEAEDIPILTHCSPGGVGTHEATFYHKLDKADLTKQPDRIVSCMYDPCTPLGYFYDEYVHPKNWRPVLMKYPKLKLCLAHFGGAEWKEVGISSDWVEEITKLTDPKIVQGQNTAGEIHFENVYTDVSCYNLKDGSTRRNVAELFREMDSSRRYGHLQDKLLFGVDWYLSLVTGAPAYQEFVERFFDAMSESDQWQWYRSAIVNPATFYGLDKAQIIDNMYTSLSIGTEDESKLKCGYERIKTLPEQVVTIRNELTRLKQASKK